MFLILGKILRLPVRKYPPHENEVEAIQVQKLGIFYKVNKTSSESSSVDLRKSSSSASLADGRQVNGIRNKTKTKKAFMVDWNNTRTKTIYPRCCFPAKELHAFFFVIFLG